MIIHIYKYRRLPIICTFNIDPIFFEMSSLLRQAVASLEKDLKDLEEEEKLESGGVKEDAKKAKVRPTIVKGKKKKKTPKRAGRL